FFFQAEDGIRDLIVMEFRRVLFRSIAPDRLRVAGKGLWGLREPDSIVDCGNSGTAIRLLAGVLAGQDFFSVLTGDTSIRRRPMGDRKSVVYGKRVAAGWGWGWTEMR